MSIHNNGTLVCCDYCGLTFEADNFDDALEQLRAAHWKQIRNGLEWESMCEDCQTAYDGY